MNKVGIRPLIALLIFSTGSGWSQTPATQKTHIGVPEFMELFRASKPIKSRLISSVVIDSALKWVNSEAAQHKELPALVIEDSVIEGDFSVADNVPLSIFFNNTTFRGKVTLNHTLFKKDASFYQCVFEQDVSFQDSTFEGVGHFVGSSFRKSAGFWNVKFKKRSSFAFAEFRNWVSFAGARFEDGANFAEIRFSNFVSFQGAFLKEITKFDPNEDFAEHIDFDGTKFEDVLDFREAAIEGTITFYGSTFNQDVFFVDLNKGQLTDGKKQRSMEFPGATFGRRLYFLNSVLTRLSFAPLEETPREKGPPKKEPSRTTISPVSVAKPASFTGLRCRSADFSEVEFHEYADFSRASFAESLSLKQTIFEQDVNFSDTEFPFARNEKPGLPSGTILDDVQFNKSVNLSWPQLEGKISVSGPNEWKRLAETFKKSDDLRGQNECTYRRLSEERIKKSGWERAEDDIEYAAWGYGLKPIRLLAWMAAIFVFFVACYFTQTRFLASSGDRFLDYRRRVRFSVLFAVRTSWTLGYGYRNTRTAAFRAIALANSVGIKVMVILVLKSVANLSPLLNDVAGRLIRF